MLLSLTHSGRVLPSPCTVLRNCTDSRPPSLFLGEFRDGGRESRVREGLQIALEREVMSKSEEIIISRVEM